MEHEEYALALAKDDYYTRPVSTPFEPDHEFNMLTERSREKLYALTQTFPDAMPFDPNHHIEVTTNIIHLQEKIKGLLDKNSEKSLLQKRLNILLDLNKINGLKRICIPQDNGLKLIYCSLAETTRGVTEKISLVSLARVKKQMHNLCDGVGELDIYSYNAERERYNLCTEAIIKLPKYGNIKEVQREAMALNISRMLGLDTSASTSISYNGRPALFIPFADIRLLNEFSIGKTFWSGFGFTGQTYSHYSTIKPVGEGIQADCFIHDFGKALALFYLSSDTDAVGSYCQNKALRNAYSLFIFDQVIMDAHKLMLDSRMSLQPKEFIIKHTRHGLGRNRTLIEDSTMDSKYTSIMQLRDLRDKILHYVSFIAAQHHEQAIQIQDKLKTPLSNEEQMKLSTELKDLIVLKKDAELLKTKIQERIRAIDNVLPQSSPVINQSEIKQALIFEKLIHNPVLFSNDGRPYKNPWTYRHTCYVRTIDDMADGLIQLTFSDKIPLEMIYFIKRRGGGDSIKSTSPNTIVISRVDLASLKENLLHPEQQLILEPNTDYLNSTDLTLIKQAYYPGQRTYIINTITLYCAKMNADKSTGIEKMQFITETEKQIKKYIDLATDKGFGMHVLKKFYFDAQQQLQRLMHPSPPEKLNDAFTAALKLDRVSEFNTLVLETIKQNKVTNPQFLEFLEECILRANAATNHSEAQKESLGLSDAIKRALHQLKSLSVPKMLRLLALDNDGDEVESIELLETDLTIPAPILRTKVITLEDILEKEMSMMYT